MSFIIDVLQENSTFLGLGLIWKLRNGKLLDINMLEPPDTHTYECIPGGYSMLMFKSFTLRNFWMIPYLYGYGSIT